MLRPALRILINLVWLLIALIIILTAVLGIVIWQFDLDDYTAKLSARMSDTLQQPVTIGSSRIAYSNGIAVELRQVNIGAESDFHISIPKVAATLEVLPLFKGRFMLNKVRLIEPDISLNLPEETGPGSGSGNSSHQLIAALGIDVLSVYNAKVDISREKASPPWDSFQAENVNAVVRNWQTETSGQLIIVGHLPAYKTDFSLDTTLPTDLSTSAWTNERLHCHLKLAHVSLQQDVEISSHKPLPRTFNVEFNLSGIPAEGVPVALKIAATSTQKPLVSLNGTWKGDSDQHDFTLTSGQAFTVPIQGEAHFFADDNGQNIYGQLRATALDLTNPELQYWQLPLISKLSSGKLNQFQIDFAQSYSKSEQPGTLPALSLKLDLSDLQWGASPLQQIPRISTQVLLHEDKLQLNQAEIITAAGAPLKLSGEINALFSAPVIDITADSTIPVATLLHQLNAPARWMASGDLPLHASLSGPLATPQLTLTSNFTAADIQLGSLFQKNRDIPAGLTINASRQNSKFRFDRIDLALDDLHIQAHGSLSPIASDHLMTAQLAAVDLEQLGRFSPLLRQREGQGKIGASIALTPENSWQGEIHIADGAAELTKILGKLNAVNGTLVLNNKGMHFSQLAAALGKSAFIIDGSLPDWHKPQLTLDLSSPRVRAHDLFFRDRQLTLYDLSGTLLIDSTGIRYRPVRLRVEDDTLVTVTGALKSFSQPQVLLDVQAETGNVLNVIKLFTGPSKGGSGKHSKGPYVNITTHIKTGTLGDLRFKNADATIRFENGLLDIYPARFENGQGYCNGRVIFDNAEKSAPLKVSGQVENIDAEVIYKDFFKKPGLISGSLDGHFYLEGKPDNNFWAQAKGGINIQVRDGVLNKFNSLAKVFSLLNVSQLFALKLPDLKTEGMPFSLLTGSLSIADGYLHTEDLKITSEAMNLSLIGRQGLTDNSLDFTLGVMPLRTVDKIITSIPIAGWILTGEDKALLTAHFKIEGTSESPKVTAIPINSLSNTVFGIFKRTLGLPGKLVKDIGSAVKKSDPPQTDKSD